ncbi:phosphotransferase [Antrihabitans sp. YC2-6]|uniref:phosphotransferase n=1 Tax=Antrihabitans sp. YC2-6 TaxID=2799498 RepID=UPI0018F5397A|nr:phosphotransferase [Antrihabitans sp. YC2-6]MBJ8346294.1 phosphotransferase [Antrihabitans sp. YC2-6]
MSADLFSIAALEPDELTRVVSTAVGRTVAVRSVRTQSFPYQWGSIPTAGLWRVDVAHDSGEYSFFVKLLRNPRLWPFADRIPEHLREEFMDYLPWRFELDMYDAGIADVLPAGMRMPTLHHVRRVADDYVVLWWEFVETSQQPWVIADFERTAFLLGELAARRRVGNPVNDRLPLICRSSEYQGALRYYTEGRVLHGAVSEIRDDQIWRSPLLAEAVEYVDDRDLRNDMLAVADRIPKILDRLEELPQTYAHGDASPQNLLIPAADSSERIVIDWGFGTPLAIGFDLGQLLVGLAHAGELDPEALAGIEAAILPAYCAGLTAQGYDHDVADVRYGFAGSLVARSALCAIPTEMLEQPVDDAARAVMIARLRLTRKLVDMAQSLE